MRKRLLKKGIAIVCCGLLIGLGMTIYTSCTKEDAHKELSENIAQNTHKHKTEIQDVGLDMSSKKSRLNELMGNLSGVDGAEALKYLSGEITFDDNNIEYKKIINLKNARSNKRDYRAFIIPQSNAQKTDNVTYYNAFLERSGKIAWGFFLKEEAMPSGTSKLTYYDLSWQEMYSLNIDNKGRIIDKRLGRDNMTASRTSGEFDAVCDDVYMDCIEMCIEDEDFRDEMCQEIHGTVSCIPGSAGVVIECMVLCDAACD